MEELGYTRTHTILAIGYLSADLAHIAASEEGEFPTWFPEPPEWLELWDEALKQTAETARGDDAG